MKGFSMKNDQGELTILLVNPAEGDVLTEQQSTRLLPYVLHALAIDANKPSPAIVAKIKASLTVSNGQLYLDNLLDVDKQNIYQLIDPICSACDSYIKEQLIVPQVGRPGTPAIRHRIMSFAPGETEGSIEVKYTELGEFNNFDVAMENLAALYPSVERIAPEEELRETAEASPVSRP